MNPPTSEAVEIELCASQALHSFEAELDKHLSSFRQLLLLEHRKALETIDAGFFACESNAFQSQSERPCADNADNPSLEERDDNTDISQLEGRFGDGGCRDVEPLLGDDRLRLLDSTAAFDGSDTILPWTILVTKLLGKHSVGMSSGEPWNHWIEPPRLAA